ncbi:HEAT repeat domain-containing protein [Membranihabitans marinus]
MVLFLACNEDRQENTDVGLLAANEKVAEYLRGFEGRGALTDESKPTNAQEALKNFKLPEDLAIDLVLSEPEIHQPVEMKFDPQGRLWVVQYNQYPFPEGVKITDIDNHMRLKFDKKIQPPPAGIRGADKITFFEDSDGDGLFDRSTDAITGLNITTSVLFGRGKIWVLSPPYLLVYSDANGDGLPEGEPEVHLDGFGLEDTHAVANSLRWGPDGWIYGAQGSTTTANISSAVSKDVFFSGQAIWRYHPHTRIFEVYAEGGGNTFNVEIDGKGRVFSGQNGYGRGPYYKQGCYYKKSWGKHGPLTNPYAFGYLPDMELDGENVRFTHALIRYEGGTLPQHYHNQFFALNALQSEIVLTGVEDQGSTLKNKDLGKIVNTDDHWFRPIDIKTGPDGNVYFTDWYDSRLSHVDIRDTWSKSTGRIYRIRSNEDSLSSVHFNLNNASSDDLIDLLYHRNKWYRFQALQGLADRGDLSVLPRLKTILNADTSTIYLESLWAINLLEGLTEDVAMVGLQHTDKYVREWTVRLIGDRRKASIHEAKALEDLARNEEELSVRSQLAASAKRLPASVALPMIRSLVLYHDDSQDSDIPLMIYWALESKAENDPTAIEDLFKEASVWRRPVVEEVLLERIIQRFSMSGSEADYKSCLEIIESSPSKKYLPKLMSGLEQGLLGKDYSLLPEKLIQILSNYRTTAGEPKLVMGLRQKNKESIESVLVEIGDGQRPMGERLTYIGLLGELDIPNSVPYLLKLLTDPSKAIQRASLQALRDFPNGEIGEKVVAQYPNNLRADVNVRLAAIDLLVSRAEWANMLIKEIQGIKIIHKEDIPIEMVKKMKLLGDEDLVTAINAIWPESKEVAANEKNKRMAEVQAILASAKGDKNRGRLVFQSTCGTCHQLFGEGGLIGPDLTGYDRRDASYFIANTIDPNADIREGYVTYTISTKSGRHLMGRIMSRSDELVQIQTLSGEEETLASSQIEVLTPLKTSLMPERLLDGLSETEIRDLFAYIQQQ